MNTIWGVFSFNKSLNSSSDSSRSEGEEEEAMASNGNGGVEAMEVGTEPQQGSSTTSSRGPGKSPAHFDPSLSPDQIKKIRLEEAKEAAKMQQQQSMDSLSEDECFEDLMYEEDEDDSSNSEEYIDYALSTRESKVSSSASEEEEPYPYEVFTPDEILQCMREDIKSASAVLDLPETTSHMLLSHFGWDQAKLTDAYYAAGDAERLKMFADARIVNPAKATGLPWISGSKVECQICFDDFTSADQMFGMPCGHRFCRSCWVTYLTTQIVDEGQGITIPCISPDCDLLVDCGTVLGLITDASVRARYQQLILSSFVLRNNLIKWCPSPDCTNAVKVKSIERGRSVTCKCGFTFCFSCAENAHAPVWCAMLKKWLKKNMDDSETSTWISVNTKECPKCHANIQKNGGCNHMMCRNRSCNEEFCWVCLGPWRNHDPYRCNSFDDEGAQNARNEQERSRASLSRYLFYYNRYMTHMNSLKLENKLYDSVQEKMDELQALHMSWVEVQFLKAAVDTLCLCRQTLMYTYVFAFYGEKTTKNNQMDIFEANQQDLHDSVEKLSGYLEHEVENENVTDLKQKVQDMTKYCESRRRVLLNHVEEGHEKDWWTFRE